MKKFIIYVMCLFMIGMVSNNVFADSSSESQSGASALSLVNPNQSQGIVDSFNSGRGFHIPSEVNFPMLPSYFGPTSPSFNFQSSKNMVMYKKVFTREELEMMAKNNGFSNPVVIVKNLRVIEVSDDMEFNQLTVYLTKPIAKEIIAVSNITVAIKSSKGVSIGALGNAGIAALNSHANAIHITAEGAQRIAESFGWGIGLNVSQADMKESGEVSTVTSGGLGVSGGTYTTIDKPWLQVTALLIME